MSAVEPSDVGWRLSERRRATSDVTIERTGLDGERIDEPDATYDGLAPTVQRPWTYVHRLLATA